MWYTSMVSKRLSRRSGSDIHDNRMTPENYAMLKEWLESGDDAQRAHAIYRLSLPDAIDFKQDKLEYPSLFQQAKNAASAVGDVVAGAIRGEPSRGP